MVGSVEWGKTDKGWISLNYVVFETADNSNVGGGTVTGSSFLRIRTGPSTSYAVAGYLYEDEYVLITEIKNVNGVKWGRISKGWISLNYIRMDQNSAPGNTGSNNNSTTGSNTGSTANGTSKTVIADCLCIRSGAGTSYSVVGYLYYGQKVTVTQTTNAEGRQWGKTSSGWIAMDYVK